MKTVSILIEVKDVDEAIRLLNDMAQLPFGELKGFNIYESFEPQRRKNNENND